MSYGSTTKGSSDGSAGTTSRPLLEDENENKEKLSCLVSCNWYQDFLNVGKQILGFQDNKLEHQFLEQQYRSKCYFRGALIFGIVQILLGINLQQASTPGTASYGEHILASVIVALGGALLSVASCIPKLRTRYWPLIGMVSAAMATFGLILYWILALYAASFQIPGFNRTCGEALLPLRISGQRMDDDIGSGLFWCANIASSFQFDSFILLSALPQCLFLFGLQAKYYILMLFVQVISSTVFMLVVQADYPSGGSYWGGSVNTDYGGSTLSITFLPYFGVVVLVGLTFSVLHTEFVSRRNFIRQKTWALFRRQVVEELGSHRLFLSETLTRLLDDDMDTDVLGSEHMLQVLRSAAMGKRSSEAVMQTLGDEIVEQMHGLDVVLKADDITLGPRLGQGAFGVVYMGTLGANTKVALKEASWHQGPDSDAEAIQEIVHEAKILHCLTHPNVVQMFGIWRGWDPDVRAHRVFMVLELCTGGTLAQAVGPHSGASSAAWGGNAKASLSKLPPSRSSPRKPGGGGISFAQKMSWASNCADAVAYLHSRGLIHRDLKPQNVLLMDDAPRTCKLADFGTSRRTAHTRGSLTTRVGTIAYMPPECLQTFGLLGPTGDNTSICGEKWDVYSLGILLNFIVTERTPHENLFDNQIVRQVLNAELRPSMESAHYRPALSSLVAEMWSTSPSDRPSAADVAKTLGEFQ